MYFNKISHEKAGHVLLNRENNNSLYRRI